MEAEMATAANSASAPAFHPFVISGRAGDFPQSQAERLAFYCAAALRRSPTREVIESAIETLISLLDREDWDDDFEDEGHSEPSLGAREVGFESQNQWSIGATDDTEWDDDGEPSLGSLERGAEAYQPAWGNSAWSDLEGVGPSIDSIK